MNGRVGACPQAGLRPDPGDPLIGRFTSADPVAQAFNTQGFNRYAYVDNNPLAFTDPTGFCGFFCILDHIFNPVTQFNDQISVLKAVYSVPVIGQVINIAAIAASNSGGRVAIKHATIDNTDGLLANAYLSQRGVA